MLIPVRHLSLVLALSLISAVALQAQPQPYRFESIPTPGGRDQNSVTDIVQDRQGFMWFGTWGGLLKYDGYTFTKYTHDPGDATSLAANWVECLYIDRAGTLWVGTFGGGLGRFDPQTETFTHYRHNPDDPTSLSHDDVRVILEDHTGALWVGTESGLNRFDQESGTFTRYYYDPEDPSSLGNDKIQALFEDTHGILWVGTKPFGRDSPPGPGGLNRFNRATGTFERYLHDPDDPTSLRSNSVMSIYEDARGTFWVGTWDDGVHTMDREAGTFTRHGYDLVDPSRVMFFLEDDAGFLWMGTLGGGLYRYDAETGDILRIERNPEDPASLSSNLVDCMYQSRDGTLWVGTVGAGINKAHRTDDPFEHYTLLPSSDTHFVSTHFVSTLHVDASGLLRVAAWSSYGLIRTFYFERDEGRSSSYRASASDPIVVGPAISSLGETRDGMLWVGTYAGSPASRQRGRLYRIDPAIGRVVHVLPDSARFGPVEVGPVTALHEDREGALWIGTLRSGLLKLDREAVALTRYGHDPDDPTRPSHPDVTALYEAPSEPGVLWVGTGGGGLHRFDRAAGTFRRYEHNPEDPTSLGGSYVTDIHGDAHGRLWVGTQQGGLNQFDRTNETFLRFDPSNSGLPDHYVACMLSDGDGHLWIGTGLGLTRFDAEAGLFYTYGSEQGVQAAPFAAAACGQAPTGELVFGGDGFIAFDPDQVQTGSSPPPVVLTGFSLARPTSGSDPKRSSYAPHGKIGEVRLAHDEHTFTFEAAALDYGAPKTNQYAYLLEGYDEAWREARTRRRVSYYRVPPGTYTFRVRAAGSDGVWNEEGAVLRLTILPPWWRTWWAYSLYGLLLILGVVAVDRFQRRRLIRRERERAEREAEKLRTEAAEAWANYLQSENQRQTQELEAARTLQLSMLPDKLPEHPRVDIAASMQTATEVGGDYYDVDVSDDGTLTLAIGDATGHGTKAGTMVTAMKSLWNAFAREDELASVLHTCSRALKRMGMPRLYMALALVRLRDHDLELVGAGLPPALIYRAAGGEVETVPLKGVPLGGPVGARYRKRSVVLSAGDTVLLMTDGFPELFNEEGEMLGYERAREIFAEVADRSPEEIIAHFEETGKAWRNGRPVSDDVTFVVVKVKAGAKGGEETPA